MTLNEVYEWTRDVWSLWPRYALHQRVALVLAVFVTGYAVYLLTAGRPAPNLVKNGGFEEGSRYWGTGYPDDRLRNGRRPSPTFPYIPTGAVNSSGDVDSTEHHGGKDRASSRIEHGSQEK